MKRFMNVRAARMLSLVLGVASAGLFATSCTDSTDPGALITLTIAPSPATVAAGGTVQFSAAGTDFTGASVTPTAGAVVWSVAAGGGSINSSTGLFTASTTPGTYTNTIVATCRGITASSTVIVTAGPLATITVTPNPVTLPISATQQFTAVGKDAFGNVVAITPVWSVVSGGGTINATSGLFTAGTTPGTFANTVKATSGTISGTATVTVTVGPLATITVTPNPVTLGSGTQQTFTAVGRDAAGNIVPVTPVWSVVNGGGTINAASGVFTAGSTAGTFDNTVRATSGSIFGSATVTVTVIAPPPPAPPALATITVTPNPATVQVNGTQQFTAVGRDGSGNIIAITPVWSIVNGGGTINSATGAFTAGPTAGTFTNTVRATSGSISGTATVIVTTTPPPAQVLTTITVEPNPATVQVGATQQFIAVGRDQSGNIITIAPVWTVTNGGGTINSSTGLFTAGLIPGTFTNTVRATSGTVFGTATVIVTAAPAPPARFGVISRVAVTCTLGSITGSVGTNQSPSEVPPGSVTGCTGATAQVGTPAAKQQYADFVTEFNSLASTPCGTVLSGTLAGQTLTPGVYCFPAAATLTGTLTLNGVGNYLFLVGTGGTGSLSTTNFNVVLSNGASACSVKWRVTQAATTVTSDFKGNILAGAAIAMTGGTFVGNASSKEDATFTGTTATGCP
ncbi:MAG: DUF3494 domain-containing protein [Gemmatimonadaceae bacterium]|nr:DUF3494 domain-containing protein [Gemmatimonadaceae bacterium]